MPESEGLTGEMLSPCRCTAMHSTGPRRGGLIPESDGTDTSKCPYMGVCNQPRCRAIMADRGVNSGSERCTFTRCTLMHDSAPKPSGVSR